MKILENHRGADARVLAEAVDALSQGKIIIYPTGTLYALGCDALNQRAIERLCALKGINPNKNSLAVVCADIAMAAAYARIDNRAFALLRRCLPGPYTFVLPAASTLPKVFKGRREVGIRIPDREFATALARELDRPLLTSSVAMTDDDAGAVDGYEVALRYDGLADIALAVDGGPLGPVPSTVVDLSDSADPVLLRAGAGPWPM